MHVWQRGTLPTQTTVLCVLLQVCEHTNTVQLAKGSCSRRAVTHPKSVPPMPATMDAHTTYLHRAKLCQCFLMITNSTSAGTTAGTSAV